MVSILTREALISHSCAGFKMYTFALKQHQLSQNSYPLCSSFLLIQIRVIVTCDMHHEPVSKKQLKSLFSLCHKCPKTNNTFFSVFFVCVPNFQT